MTTTLSQETLPQGNTLPSSPPSKYRFSAVDDLQLPPALSVTTETPLEDALMMALEREYSQLTVISPGRKKLLGYLDVLSAIQRVNEGKYPKDRQLAVGDMYRRFDRRKSVGYQVITPDTSLDVLDEFLKTNDFAIGLLSSVVS